MVADTHVPRFALPVQLSEGLQGVDLILHAGDLCTLSVMEELQAIAPVLGVHGNQDGGRVMEALPDRLQLDLEGHAILMIHGHSGKSALTAARLEARRQKELDCVIFGHSHHAYNQYDETVLLFNPGSPTWKRAASSVRSFGLLTVDGGVRGQICEIPEE